ncbi:virulence factor TspB C-terminal domain-related protein [Neisseria sp. P0006.S004]|uniref:virulence factor TspB C-terminal domain-related protein n=1 Tax=unclassified Neisseria TaxID=2623750 RepID=UPI003F7D8BF0
MKNDTRISIFIGYCKAHNISRLSVCLGSFLVVGQAWAEVGLPPPAQHQNAGFPSDQALQRRGYDPKTGIWKVDVQNNGKPTVTKNGGNINGSQGKTVTVTGRYGETGTMNTNVNQRVNVGKVETVLGGTLAGATAMGGAIGSDYAAWTYRDIKNGDWAMAARNGVGAILTGLSKLDITGLGSGINSFLDKTGLRDGASQEQISNAIQKAAQAQRQAEAEGNYQKAVAQAAAKKAAEAAKKAQQQDQQKKEEQKREEEAKAKGLYAYDLILMKSFQPNMYKSESSTTYKSFKVYSNNSNLSIYSNGFITNDNFYNSISTGLENPSVISLGIENLSNNSRVYYELRSYPAGSPNIPNAAKHTDQVNQSDFMLTQKEMLDILKRMLENNQTNHAELMNQLSKMGVMNQSAESSTFSPDTALSAPYTPQGSSTPQQTRFKMNQDGTVGVDYVPRPDLKPNSPEAPNKPEKTTPSRQESPDTPNTPNSPNTPTTPNNPTGQQNQNQENQQQNFCQQNPNTAQCMPSGDATYEDIKLPEQTIDLNFKPLNVFQSDGTCPAPRSVDFGALGQVEFSYDPLCDLARKLRPIFIAICVLTCAYFVYESVKEL